jgi:site-specific recombinase XerD
MTTPGPVPGCSRRNGATSTAPSARVGAEALRAALADAAGKHLPDWPDKITPHVLRHFCASQLYLSGMDLIAIQEVLGHSWIATTMRYVNPPGNCSRWA